MSAIEEYRVFVAIVTEGSLTGAAKALHLSPSAVSKRLAQLEQRLGVTLVDRSTRAQAITAAGQEFHCDCLAILRAVADAEERVQQQCGQIGGKLHLSCPRVLVQPGFMRLLNEFREQYPGIRLDLSISDREEGLIEGGLDAVIRIGSLRDSRLCAARLGQTRGILCAAPDYLKRKGAPDALSKLREHNVILPTYINLTEKQRLLFSRQTELDLDEFDTCNDALAILARVREGGGIAMMLDVLVAPELVSGSLVNLFPERVFPAQPITLLWRRDRQDNDKLRLFREFISAGFANNVVCA